MTLNEVEIGNYKVTKIERYEKRLNDYGILVDSIIDVLSNNPIIVKCKDTKISLGGDLIKGIHVIKYSDTSME
jgi:Fe2+ transport system protein FeoA